MTDSRPLSAFFARPDQSLDTHLKGVDAAGQQLIDGAGITPYGDDWADVIETLSWTHDIGKLTSYFQEYIETGTRKHAPHSDLTYHGTVSSFVTVLALHQRGFSKRTIAAGFYAVAKHHSVLQNIRADFGTYFKDASEVNGIYKTSAKQFDNIDDKATTAAETIIDSATDEWSWDELTGMPPREKLGTVRGMIKGLAGWLDDPEFYGCALRAWSTLVAADKFDASGLTSVDDLTAISNPTVPPVEALTTKVQSVSDTPLPTGGDTSVYLDDPDRPLPGPEATVTQRLDAIRTAANGQATPALKAGFETGQRVFELTLPTGFGKTYTGLRAALTLAHQRESRVIYALPYTSIIDQVDNEIQDVFDLNPSDPDYTKHHHLADTLSRLADDDAFPDDASSGAETLHAESWRSGLVLTTFTQLFESAAGPGNVQSTKLPALQDSVIIIDEPQAIPHDWWPLVGRLTAFLAAEYDATLLFMTATQPQLLSKLPDVPTPQSLVGVRDDAEQLIADTPRVTFELHESLSGHLDRDGTAALEIDAAADEITTQLGPDTDSLAIVNTVGSASTLAESLSEPGSLHLGAELLSYLREQNTDSFDPKAYLNRLATSNPDTDTLVATLTTRIRPTDRRALLDCLSRILDDDTQTPFDDIPTVTVSTQLIEAGVDLSFDQLFRDYAPLPAIVQAAGRCNRRFGGDPSTVTMWRLDSPSGNDYVPSKLIYDSFLRPTKGALRTLRESASSQTLSEAAMISTGVDEYYTKLHRQLRTADQTDELVEAFNSAKGKRLRNESLINSEYQTKEFAVLVTDAETTMYTNYQQLKGDKQWQRARKKFQQLKQTLVSVPMEDRKTDELTVIDTNQDSTAYEVVTGRGVLREGTQTDTEV